MTDDLEEDARIRRAIEIAFKPQDRAAVRETLYRYTGTGLVHWIILALAQGDLSAVERLVFMAQEDVREILRFLEEPDAYDPKLTTDEFRHRFQELRLPVPAKLMTRHAPASWLERMFRPGRRPVIRLVAANDPARELGDTRIGGAPSWIGDALPPACCGSAMLFLGQFDSLAVSESCLPAGSLVLVFVCPRCYAAVAMVEGAPVWTYDPDL